jgi:signal transduction histidine kinase
MSTWLIQLISSALIMGIGIAVWYSNPKRGVNIAFFWLSVSVTAWEGSIGLSRFLLEGRPDLAVRIGSVLAAFIPWRLWLVKDAILESGRERKGSVRARTILLGAGIALGGLAITPLYLKVLGNTRRFVPGPGWEIYGFALAALFLGVGADALRSLKTADGIAKLEMRILLLGGSLAGVLGTGLAVAGPVLRDTILPPLSPLVTVIFYGITTWAITSHRVFDAGHLFRALGRVALLFGGCVAVIAICDVFARSWSRPALWVLMAVAITGLYYLIAGSRRTRLDPFSGDTADTIRSTLLRVLQNVDDVDDLLERAQPVLRDWARNEHVYLLPARSANGSFASGDFVIPRDSPLHQWLSTSPWATPEQLSRLREHLTSSVAAALMRDRRLGLLVYIAETQDMAPLVIAFGYRHNRTPFSYPEVRTAQDLGEMIAGALSRVELMRRTREAERLATAGLLGVGIAHEIRNPLVSIKSIAQAVTGSQEREAEALRLFREIVPSEVDRIQVLVDGLMDLGRPSNPSQVATEAVKLETIISTTNTMIRANATEAEVAINLDLQAADGGRVLGSTGPLRQVFLNLLMNAIQALEECAKPREISIRTWSDTAKVYCQVSDNGPGIPSDVRDRIFSPLYSTKTHGLGLGLALSRKIVTDHGGAIELLESRHPGSTFQIILPCAPTSL